MSPGVVPNSETTVEDPVEYIVSNNDDLFNDLMTQNGQMKMCPIDLVNGSMKYASNGILNGTKTELNGHAFKNGDVQLNGGTKEIKAETVLKNGEARIVEEVTKVEEVQILEIPLEKPVRRVIRPKVLKNLESHNYLYDRLYDETCPRVVSIRF